MRRVISIVLSAIVLAAPQAAVSLEASATLKPLITADETRGWEAVGRINFGKTAYCTGALIAEDVVLTAAHCLYDPATGARFLASEIEFLAGWRHGRAAAIRGISRVETHPDFTYSAIDRISRVAHDLALLKLDRPIRMTSITPFEVDNRPRKGAEVGVVSYARDRSEAASLQESCRVLARQGGVLVLSCEVDHGASGAPIFVIEDGQAPRIVSVVSAMAKVREHDVALGTALTRPLATLQEIMAQPLKKPEPTQLVSRDLPAIDGAGAGGSAKFLKPAN